MSRSYRRYSTEFKWALVQEVVVRGRSVRSVAAEGGIQRTLLIYWLQKHSRGDFSGVYDPRYNSGLLYQRLNVLEATVADLRAQLQRLTTDENAEHASGFTSAVLQRIDRLRQHSNDA